MGRNPSLKITSSIIIMIIASQLLLLSLSNEVSGSYDPYYFNEAPYEWPEDNAEDYGFNTSRLEDLHAVADEISVILSTLVIRHGKLLVEWYFNNGTQNRAFHIHSASKSFTSALVGIALREGFLESVDQKLVDFFPEYFTPEMDPRKWDITIKHLLTMTAGFNFSEYTDQWIAYSSSENWVRHAIELPLLHSPGEDWNYGTVQTNLLSAILTRATGMSTRDFAEEYLFDPLNITISHWYQDPQGYYTGGHEMYFVPRNMARYGYLYLNNGSVEGNQIVPSSWVQESLTDYEGADIHSVTIGYGYQWWLAKWGEYITFSARGLGGQFIVCVPELDMVVVTTATGNLFNYNSSNQNAIRQLIFDIMLSVDPGSSNTTTSTTISSTTTTISGSTTITGAPPTTTETSTTEPPPITRVDPVIIGLLAGIGVGVVAVMILFWYKKR